jgi:hypothetical protein
MYSFPTITVAWKKGWIFSWAYAFAKENQEQYKPLVLKKIKKIKNDANIFFIS